MKLFEPKSGSPPSWRDRLLLHYRRRGWRGFLRLYNFLKPAVARREIRTISKYGSEFFIEHQDAVDAHVINEGFYESEVLEAVRPSLGTDAVLWVIGANRAARRDGEVSPSRHNGHCIRTLARDGRTPSRK